MGLEVNQTPPATIQVTDGALIPAKGKKNLLSSWAIAFSLAVALLVLLPILKPDPYWNILRTFPSGILVTFQVTILAILLATFIGVLTGIGQISKNPVINRVATVYVEIIRGIPLLVQIFFLYFALGRFLRLEDFPAAVLSMSICYGAYMGEVFRAGIQAIPKGQMEAALSQGFTRGQALRLIILPQTVKIILPAIGNEFIALLKDSSLVSIVALTDLFRQARNYASVTFNYFDAYLMVALVYLVLTLFLSRLVGLLEERLKGHD